MKQKPKSRKELEDDFAVMFKQSENIEDLKILIVQYFKKQENFDLLLLGAKQKQKEKRRKELEDKAFGRILNEHNLDIIHYLNDEDTKQYLELEYELGYSEYNPNEA